MPCGMVAGLDVRSRRGTERLRQAERQLHAHLLVVVKSLTRPPPMPLCAGSTSDDDLIR